MGAEQTPGHRLKAYIRARWTRRDGGDTALATKAGVSRQTLQAWYAGADLPRLDNLAAVADALGVRRVDLLAAMDGVTAPEQQEAPPPQWATALADETAKKVIEALALPADVLATLSDVIALLEGPELRDGDSTPADGASADRDESVPPGREGG